MFRLFGRPKVPLEDQIQTLAECGIRLRDGITLDDLLVSWGRQQFEKEPYELVLVAMGGDVEEEPFDRISDDIWHLDTECIEGRGSYVAIAERMRDLAGGELPLEAIQDEVDIDEGLAWLSFRLDGELIRWEPIVEDDWVDPGILTRFASLLPREDGGRRFTYLDLDGQDCIIGCSTPAQLKALRQATGLKFVWLK